MRGPFRGAALFFWLIVPMLSCAGARSPLVRATKTDVWFSHSRCSVGRSGHRRDASVQYYPVDRVSWEEVKRDVRKGHSVLIEDLPRSELGRQAFVESAERAKLMGLNVCVGNSEGRMRQWKPALQVSVARNSDTQPSHPVDVKARPIETLEGYSLDDIDKALARGTSAAIESEQIWPGFMMTDRPVVWARTDDKPKIFIFGVKHPQISELILDLTGVTGLPMEDLSGSGRTQAVACGVDLRMQLEGKNSQVGYPDEPPVPGQFSSRFAALTGKPVLLLTYSGSDDPEELIEILLHEAFHMFFQWKPEAKRGQRWLPGEPQTWNLVDGGKLYACEFQRSEVEQWVENPRMRKFIDNEMWALADCVREIARNSHPHGILPRLEQYLTLRKNAVEQGVLTEQEAKCIGYWERIEGTAQYVGMKGLSPDAHHGDFDYERLVNRLEEPDHSYFLWQGCGQMIVLDFLEKLRPEIHWQTRLYASYGPSSFPHELIAEIVNNEREYDDNQ